MRAPNPTDRLEPALVHGVSRHPDIEQGPDQRLPQPAVGHLAPQLGDASLHQGSMQQTLLCLARRLARGRVDAERRLHGRGAVDREEGLLGEFLGGRAPRLEPVDDLLRQPLLRGKQRIVGTDRLTARPDPLGRIADPGQERVARAEHLVGEPKRVHPAHRLRHRRRHRRLDPGLQERPVEREVDLRQSCRSLKAPLVGEIVAAQRADVVERAGLAAHHPLAGHEVGVVNRLALRRQHRLVEPGRQDVDQVDVRGELVVLLFRHAGGDEDPQVPDLVVDGVDDGLAVGADFVHVVVEVEDPVERLLRRRDVVAARAEDDDRRADVAQVDRSPVRRADLARRQVVADEELVDDPLHLLGVQGDVAAPPFLEVEVALGLGVDLRPEVVLFAPERVGRVLVLEVLHQGRAVEDAGAEVAGQRGQPRPSEQPTRVAHRILAAHASPIGQRRPGEDDRPEELGPECCDQHHRPPGLAVADHARLALGLGMAGDDRLEEGRFGAGDVEDGLARHRVGQEADEVGRMPGLHRHADLAVGLEAADPGAVAGARIDDHERPLPRVDLDALGGQDASEQVVDRPLEPPAVKHQLGLVVEHVRRDLRPMRLVLDGSPTHHVEEEHRPLPGVHRIGGRLHRVHESSWSGHSVVPQELRKGTARTIDGRSFCPVHSPTSTGGVERYGI